MEELTKTCRQCGTAKPLAAFHRNKASADGRVTACKPCANAYAASRRAKYGDRLRAENREYHQKNRERIRPRATKNSANFRAANPDAIRNNWLRHKYGISLADWNGVFAAQGSACAACRATTPGGNNRWHTDHCHATGTVRGILCHSCNVSLGLLQDSSDRVLALYNYLTRPSLTTSLTS